MSALSYAVTDSATMLRRNLRHALRYPSLTMATLLTPIVILLLFVGVLRDTLGAGLDRPAAGGAGYVDYADAVQGVGETAVEPPGAARVALRGEVRDAARPACDAAA